MATRQPLSLVGGAYKDDVLPWSAQDTQNMLVVTAERGGTRTPSMLRQVPGMYRYLTLGAGPIRGVHDVEGSLFVVSAGYLYQVNTDRSYAIIGTISGVGRVVMAHNQVAGGNQLVIGTGTTGYLYDTSTSTFSTITDDSFVGATSLDYVDGYITFVEPGGRYWGTSELADASNYSALDRYDSETSPDKITTHIVSNRQVLVFNQKTTEVFYDSGAATGTFQRQNGVSINVGCTSRFTPARVGDTVAFLGSDGIVYLLNGYTPQRISTHAIEQAIARCNTDNAYATVYESQGHRVYYLTLPDGNTWGYDLSSGEWHRRQSFGLNRWRANSLVRWNKLWLAGDYTNGNLYVVDWNTSTESTSPLIRSRTCSVVHANQNRVSVSEVEPIIQTGGANQTAVDLDNLGLSLAGDLPNGVTGSTVSYQYIVRNGSAPISCMIDSGSLPPGLSMSSSGLITGTRTTVGTYSWVVRATDSLSHTVTLADTSDTLAQAPVLASPGNFWSGARSALVAATPTGFTPVPSGATIQEYRAGGYVVYAGSGPSWYVAQYTESTGAFTYLTVSGTKYGQIATLSHDAQWLVTANDVGSSINLYVYQRSGTVLTLVNGPYSVPISIVSTLKFSPDDSKVAQLYGNAVGNLRVHTFNTTTGVLTVGAALVIDTVGIAWHPGSRYLACLSGQPIPSNGTLSLRDTSTSTYPVVGSTAQGGSGNGVGIAFAPSGNYLYASSKYNGGALGVARYSVSTSAGVAYQEAYDNTTLITSVNMSHDGLWLATCNYGSSSIRTYSVNQTDGTLTLSQTLTGISQNVFWINYDLTNGQL